MTVSPPRVSSELARSLTERYRFTFPFSLLFSSLLFFQFKHIYSLYLVRRLVDDSFFFPFFLLLLLSSCSTLPVDQIPAKVFLIGDQRVGKTSLLRRFCNGGFDNENAYRPTAYSEIKFEEVVLNDGTKMTLQLWYVYA